MDCEGYFKHKNQVVASQEELPCQRSQVSTIGSQVCFSLEEIDFGLVKAQESEHRILILYNLSEESPLVFNFKNTGLVCGDELTIEPISGELEAKQFVEIKLTLISNVLPSNYEGEIECKISWNSS